MKFVLASASERRKELLSRIIKDFEVRVSDFDEESVRVNEDIEKYVKTLSEGKARSVALNYSRDSIIIGADTIVVIDNNVLGKPKDKNDAFRMLKSLSNNVHRVYSGVTVINNSTKVIKSECLYTEVYFSELSDEEIWKYIDTGECLDKAGAYGIQGFGGVFVKSINGCYYNVVGLPLNLLNKMIKEIL
ncbi:Maf-like protein [Clostridium sp. D53t1_180928_C8]|uniref:Maf-like protein n=1 Tax=Clostridium sp. D53t1_180928_C8 TaxID=2787101 RepID=UPI0018A9F9F1|nr:Maf-like protein [Clostridium sp. D53t1_180928_C8]